MSAASDPKTPGVHATRASLIRLLRQHLSHGGSDAAEVGELLQALENARDTDELGAVAQRVLAVVGPRLRGDAIEERRAHPRRACSLMVRILEDGSHGMHFIRDLGLGGMSVYIQAPLPLFPTLHCQLPLYHLGKQYSFTARVVWCQPEPPAVVGLQFVEIGTDAKEWIQSFLDS